MSSLYLWSFSRPVETPDVLFIYLITVILLVDDVGLPVSTHLPDVHPVVIALTPVIQTPGGIPDPTIFKVFPADILLHKNTGLRVVYL